MTARRGARTTSCARTALIGACLAHAACVSPATVDGSGAGWRQVPGPDGIDAWVVFDEGPSLVDFRHEGGRFLTLCEPSVLSATFQDDEGQPFTVGWEIYGPRLTDGTPGPLDLSSSTPLAGAVDPVETSLSYACPTAGIFDVQVSAVDDHGAQTTFVTGLRCLEPSLGACETGDPPMPVGADTCTTSDWVLLDSICVQANLGPLPACLDLCPDAQGASL